MGGWGHFGSGWGGYAGLNWLDWVVGVVWGVADDARIVVWGDVGDGRSCGDRRLLADRHPDSLEQTCANCRDWRQS